MMSFKDNLLKKIKIDFLTQNVLRSMGPPESGKKIDRHSLRGLLDMSSYSHRKERDLDLYIRKADRDDHWILVFGNELPLFKSTIEDVVMRRSPTIKEMISIRNAIKILNDQDILISKGAETIKTIQKECIDLLDLSFKESDLLAIERDGAASLRNSYADGVLECLSLFASLLEYVPPPTALEKAHFRIYGATRKQNGKTIFGPMVVYGMINNDLKYYDERISLFDKEQIESFHARMTLKGNASTGGPEVLSVLRRRILESIS